MREAGLKEQLSDLNEDLYHYERSLSKGTAVLPQLRALHNKRSLSKETAVLPQWEAVQS